MAFPPEAYIIGAQKAGTTTLAYLLDQHPYITVSQPKEPHFFTHNYSRGLDWYKDQFPGPSDTLYVDASTSYTMAPLSKGFGRTLQTDYEGVPAKLYRTNPDAKLIYILRDPVDRTYSGYWHNLRMGAEDRGFSTTMLSDPFYLDVSDYHGQLLLWLEYFPLQSVFFVLFEDVKVAPETTALECCAFLGVGEPAVSMRLDSAKNQSLQVNWVGRRMNALALAYPAIRTVLESHLPRYVVDRLKRLKAGSARIPQMKAEDEAFLIEYFRERNENLEEITGLSLNRWRR